tara:strand:+ start:180 stop:518 length:339 start_codon:yes stop_codon:yes gene_type:complete
MTIQFEKVVNVQVDPSSAESASKAHDQLNYNARCMEFVTGLHERLTEVESSEHSDLVSFMKNWKDNGHHSWVTKEILSGIIDKKLDPKFKDIDYSDARNLSQLVKASNGSTY